MSVTINSNLNDVKKSKESVYLRKKDYDFEIESNTTILDGDKNNGTSYKKQKVNELSDDVIKDKNDTDGIISSKLSEKYLNNSEDKTSELVDSEKSSTELMSTGTEHRERKKLTRSVPSLKINAIEQSEEDIPASDIKRTKKNALIKAVTESEEALLTKSLIEKKKLSSDKVIMNSKEDHLLEMELAEEPNEYNSDVENLGIMQNEKIFLNSVRMNAEPTVIFYENQFIDLSKLQFNQEHAPGYDTLLPPKNMKLFGNKKCLILDLDETLVHSTFKCNDKADFILPVTVYEETNIVYIIKRPGVDEFLKRVGELFEVVLFTASVSRYGEPLLNILDKHKIIHHRLYRESCYFFENNFVKNLSQIGRPLSDLIILDNSPASYLFHPHHAVPISSWFSDSHDTELLDILPLLEDLSKSTSPDVSKVLNLSI